MRFKAVCLKICVLITISAFLVEGRCLSQKVDSVYPTIGDRCPPFELYDVHHFTRSKVSLNEFEGKWLVLDFWNRFCGACVTSFPRTDALQAEFKGKVQFLLVGYTGSQYRGKPDDSVIRIMYEKIRIAENLRLAIGYDSSLFHRFRISACPFIIIIDKSGIVRYITNRVEREDLRHIIEGDNVELDRVYRDDDNIPQDVSFNSDKPFLVGKNGGNDSDFLFRSLISNWKTGMPYGVPRSMDECSQLGMFQLLGVRLIDLYNYAFLGKASLEFQDSSYGEFGIQPVLNVKDSTLFLKKRLFCYSLIFRDGSRKGKYALFQNIMQNDLRNYFGFKAAIVVKELPYWALTATDSARIKLPTKGGPTWANIIPHIKYNVNNKPISHFLNLLWVDNQQEIFIDETRISENIDISLNCILANIADVNMELRKYGLTLIQRTRRMKVVEIEDFE